MVLFLIKGSILRGENGFICFLWTEIKFSDSEVDRSWLRGLAIPVIRAMPVGGAPSQLHAKRDLALKSGPSRDHQPEPLTVNLVLESVNINDNVAAVVPAGLRATLRAGFFCSDSPSG